MIPGDADYARLEHQVVFLYVRGLASDAMWECEARIRALEALSGDPSRLDSHIRERLLDELEEATLNQLESVGRFDAWQRSWAERVDMERTAMALGATHGER